MARHGAQRGGYGEGAGSPLPRHAAAAGADGAGAARHARAAEASLHGRYGDVFADAALSAAHRHEEELRMKALVAGRRRRRKRKRVVCAAVAVVLAVVLALVGAAAVFALQLDSRLAPNDVAQREELDRVLTDAEMGKPFYALVMGSDSREGSGTSKNPANSGDNERSDVMILVRVDAANRQLTMVTVPRDTPLFLEDGSVVKINESYNMGGAAATIEAVSELTGVPISHYAEVRFSDLQGIVDSLGGVTVDVPVDLSYKDALTGEKVTVPAGEQTLTGQQAQIFARARHEYGSDQDAHRQEAVRTLAMAIMKSALDRPVHELPGTILDLAEYVGTDLKTGDLVSLALAYAGGSGKMTVYSCSGPSDGELDLYGNGMWLCYENPEGWQRLMAAVDAGENPEGIDVNA